jgi:hypothetical protein
MAGPPVTIGCAVVLSPGAAGAPDSGVIVSVPQGTVLAGGMPIAVAGSICQMVNSVSGVPYPLPIPPTGVSTGMLIDGNGVVRMGDSIPAGPGVLTVLGPPALPTLTDGNAP